MNIINTTRRILMLNKDIHREVFISILRDIYSDTLLRTNLGFKGGTAAMLFYGLPRFSVDLDFNLLDPEKKEAIFEKLKEILPKYGNVIQAREKYYTLFFLLSYKKGERGLKIEISKRPLQFKYVPKNFLGISMLVMKEDDMVAGKLSALLTRREFAMRDLFDMWFFLKEHWDINERTLKENTGLTLAQALKKARIQIKKIKKNEILAGLGDLLDNKQKAFVKEKLQDELIFQLNLRQSFLHNVNY